MVCPRENKPSLEHAYGFQSFQFQLHRQCQKNWSNSANNPTIKNKQKLYNEPLQQHCVQHLTKKITNREIIERMFFHPTAVHSNKIQILFWYFWTVVKEHQFTLKIHVLREHNVMSFLFWVSIWLLTVPRPLSVLDFGHHFIVYFLLHYWTLDALIDGTNFIINFQRWPCL